MLGQSLQARVHETAHRMRAQRALDAAVLAGIASLAVLAIGLLCAWRGRSPVPAALIACVVLLPLLAATWAALRPLSMLGVASTIDRSHALSDLVSSAWAFAALPERERTAFMAATCEHATRTAPSILPAHAAPFGWPRHSSSLMCVAIGVACLSQLPAPASPAIEAVSPPASHSLLAADDAQAFRADIDDVLAGGAAPTAIQAEARELTALLQALADGKTDRVAALAALHDMEARLAGERARAEQIGDALRDLGHSLEGSPATRKLGEALSKNEQESASREAEQLAARARDGQVDAKSAQALQRALAEHKKRELDRLEREKPAAQAQRDQARRELDKLRSKLSDAAQALSHAQRDAAGHDLDGAAEQLQQLQKAQAGAAQAQALAERTRELRELLRREREGTSEQARPGQGTAAGETGRPQSHGAGTSGSDQALTLEHFRELARGKGNAEQTGNGSGSAPGAQSGEPASAGPGGGPPRSDASAAPAATSTGTELRIAGQAGRGPTRSQVIYEAASHGFAARAYSSVHTDYARHAETELSRDEIPGGYRFYVRRYFQLIRPREDVHD